MMEQDNIELAGGRTEKEGRGREEGRDGLFSNILGMECYYDWLRVR